MWTVIRYIVTSLFVLCGIFMIVTIMLQESKGQGLGALGGMSSSSTETYWEKNKYRSKEGKLARFTRIAAIFFFVAALLWNINF